MFLKLREKGTSHERDPVKLLELAKELEQALEQRAGKLAQNSTPSKAQTA
jgi:hypothetical protein